MKIRYVMLLSGVLACGNAAADVGDRVEDRLDHRGDRIEDRLDERGDRVEDRLDHRGDRINDRLDRQSDRAEDRGHDKLAARLDLPDLGQLAERACSLVRVRGLRLFGEVLLHQRDLLERWREVLACLRVRDRGLELRRCPPASLR